MNIFEKIFSLRVNLLIVFMGAFTVILMIKLTSLLPEKYYFNFSTLYGGDSSPFLVDPPAVSGKKLCNILRRNKIKITSTKLEELQCNTQEKNEANGLSLSQKNELYDIAIRTDQKARIALKTVMNGFVLQPLSVEEQEAAFEYSKSVKDVFNNLIQKHEASFRDLLHTKFLETIESDYSVIDLPKAQENEGSKDQISSSNISLPVKTHQNILKAYQEALVQIMAIDFGKINPKMIGKSEIDDVLKEKIYDSEDAAERVFAKYFVSYSKEIKRFLGDSFRANNLSFNENKFEVKATLLAEITKEGWFNYVISILVRVLPVLFFGLVLGIYFGKSEFVSISMAAALAALLLSWPVMLLWDQVVVGVWLNKKSIFVAFYIAYMITFYYTASLGAMMGGIIRPRISKKYYYEFSGLVTGKEEGIDDSSVNLKEFGFSVLSGVSANILLYAANLIIPVMA